MVNNVKSRAFTLVELLVVISIIALLLAILMPALNKARNQARVVVCTANAKQLGLAVMTYRADNKDFVPIMLNRWIDASYKVPTKEVLLSLALRSQVTKVPLPTNPNLNPDTAANFWANNQAKMNYYLKRYMPAFFTCPFLRGKAIGSPQRVGTISIGSSTFASITLTGSADCWTTPLHPSLREVINYTSTNKGAFLGSKGFQYLNHPLGMPNGSLKYATLSWFSPDWSQPIVWPDLKPTRWSSSEIRAMRGSGPSDAVVTYCYAGETCEFYGTGQWAIANYKSHMRGKQGGTDALFADGHVEWVEGTRIGWD